MPAGAAPGAGSRRSLHSGRAWADNAGMELRLLLAGITESLVLLLLLGVTLAALHVAYTAWVRHRFPADGEFVVHEGARLHFVRTGQGPAVILIHGANGTGQDFPASLTGELASDHTVIVFDRPGHGWSDAPPGPLGLRENVAALEALTRLLRLEQVTLVGHSYGAAVAMRAAIESPDLFHHVVAVTPCTAIDARNARYANAPYVGTAEGRWVLQCVALLLLPFARRLRAQAWHPGAPPRGWSASRAFAYTPSQMHASARNFRALHADMAWLEDHIRALSGRLTVVSGASDRVTPPARHVDWLAKKVAKVTLLTLKGVGHWLPIRRPEVVAEAVRNASSGSMPVWSAETDPVQDPAIHEESHLKQSP